MVTKRFLRTVFMALPLYMALASAAFATDLNLRVPDGWSFDVHGTVHAASPHGFAVGVHKYQTNVPENVYRESRIVQYVDGATYSTDFPGKIHVLRYSPGGERLIASQVGAPDLGRDERRTILLDDHGRIIWQTIDSRPYFFSTTGEVIFAWRRSGMVEIFDLDGKPIKHVSIDASTTDVVVLGRGDRVIFALAGSVLCLNVGPPLATEWRIDEAILMLEPFDRSRLLATQEGRRFMVIGLDGTVQYRYDLDSLSAESGGAPSGYARLIPQAGVGGSIALYDGSPKGFVADPVSGTISPRTFNATPPAGFEPHSRILDGKLFFFSPDEIRVRSLDSD